MKQSESYESPDSTDSHDLLCVWYPYAFTLWRRVARDDAFEQHLSPSYDDYIMDGDFKDGSLKGIFTR